MAYSLVQAEAWGRPTFTAPPSGAVLRARFCAQDVHLQDAWQNLTHALGGLFCSSLHLMVSCIGRAVVLESLCVYMLPACGLLSSVYCSASPAAIKFHATSAQLLGEVLLGAAIWDPLVQLPLSNAL